MVGPVRLVAVSDEVSLLAGAVVDGGDRDSASLSAEQRRRSQAWRCASVLGDR